MIILETDRLILRDFYQDDLDDFYEYAKSPKVGPMAGWKPHESKEETFGILVSFRKKQEVWAIYHKESEKVIGSIGIHKKSLKNEFELGYVLSEDYWGQGLVKEGCLAVIDFVFNDLNIEKLVVEHFLSNIQSKRVIEKLGFRYVTHIKNCFTMYNGVKHDCLRYELERNEYNAKT